MLVATFGPSSAFAYWCLFSLNTITEVVLGEFDYIGASTVHDLKAALGTRRKKHLHLYSDCPDQGLIKAILGSRIPFIILEEDPVDVHDFLIRERGLGWMEALRLASLFSATTAPLYDSPLALRLTRSERLTLGQFVGQVATHLGLDVEGDLYRNILQRLHPSGDPDRSIETIILEQIANARPRRDTVDLPPFEQSIAMPVLASMRHDRIGKLPESLRWPADLFVGHAGISVLLSQPIEMLGPARCLIYGPYLHLPVGQWQLSLSLDVADNYSGNALDIDIFHGRVLQMESFKLPPAGQMSLKLRVPVSESREPLQIRLIQREGAIEGLLKIGDVYIQRLAIENDINGEEI
ncbi:hypothetical protein [Rhizobium sp. SL86]|uniref:hypothetical protein n=1 Tax=Rhizobium sp. SL86 TaxID=2995148 RepID=UPI00227250E7|nr:hypothetical protein [Rhizobium sp. SL86]MCY1669379.1 hypothetical protein [Rhizobium sp. SL86]